MQVMQTVTMRLSFVIFLTAPSYETFGAIFDLVTQNFLLCE